MRALRWLAWPALLLVAYLYAEWRWGPVRREVGPQGIRDSGGF